MDVLGHQSVPSARGGVAQSHGCCQCMSGLRCSFGIKNETRRGYGCKSIRFLLSRHRLPYRLDMQRITLAVLLLSYPSRPAITRPGWGLKRMAHGTANDWCADERSGGRDAHMTTRTASTLPRLPWDCCHETSVAPRADLCSATGRLTTAHRVTVS